MNEKKGQITVGIGVLITVSTLVASSVMAFATTQISTQKEFGNDRERIATLEAQTENFQKWLTRIEGKLDKVIDNKQQTKLP